jgi:hypothetical protein
VDRRQHPAQARGHERRRDRRNAAAEKSAAQSGKEAPLAIRISPLHPSAGERVIASGFDATIICCLARLNEGRFRVCLEAYGGGFGAAQAADGADGIAAPLSNTTNSPIEALEMEFDYFRIAGYSLYRRR